MLASNAALNTLYDEKINNITREIDGSYTRNLLLKAGDNTPVLVDYLSAMKIEVNYSAHYGGDTIRSLCRFSKYHNNKPLKDITRNDIVNFLDSLRKTETQDPLHKWIGTYNL